MPYDTTTDEMAQLLPTALVVTYDDERIGKLACTWENIEQSTTASVYRVKCKVDLPEGITDLEGILNNIYVEIILQQENMIIASSQINMLDEKGHIEPEQSKLN